MAMIGGGLVALLLAAEGVLRLLTSPYSAWIPYDRSERIVAIDDPCEHPWTRGASNAVTVAIVGDSVAMGVGNQRCHRLAFTLEFLLNLRTSAPPARVVALTQPSATYQQVKAVREAIEAGARLIVLAVSLNDTEDWSDPAELMRRRPDLRAWKVEGWLRPLAARSRLLRHVLLAVERERRRRGYLAYYRFLHRPDYAGMRRFTEAVREMKASCDASSVRLCAMLFPLLNQDLRPGRYEFLPMHESVAMAFREAGIPFLDLYPAMARCDPDRLQAIPMVDHHPSEIAHRIAAEELFFFLLEERLIEPERTPRRFNERDRIAVWHRKFEALGQPPTTSPPAR